MVSLGIERHWNGHLVSIHAMVSRLCQGLLWEVCNLDEELIHHLQMKDIPLVSQNHRHNCVEFVNENVQKLIGVNKQLVV
jgi:hypothetical protein